MNNQPRKRSDNYEKRAQSIRATVLQRPDDIMEENVDYSQRISKDIATAGTQQGKLFGSDDQRELLEKLSKTLERIALSEKDTTTERKEINKLMAKLIVKSDEEIEKLKQDIEARKTSQSELEENGIDSEKDKAAYEKLGKEIKKLSQAIEGQKGFQKSIEKTQGGSELGPRKTFSQSFGHGLALEAKKILPGLDFRPKEGESYSKMFGRNFAEATTGKGSLSKALFTVAPKDRGPSLSSRVNAEREASRVNKGKEFGPRGFGNGLSSGIKNPSATLDKNGRWRDENNRFTTAPDAAMGTPKGASASPSAAQANLAPTEAPSGGMSLGGGIAAAAGISRLGAIGTAVGNAATATATAVGTAGLAVPAAVLAGGVATIYGADYLWNRNIDNKTKKNKEENNAKMDAIAKKQGFGDAQHMFAVRRERAARQQITNVGPTSGAMIEDMSGKATESNAPAPSVTNITNNNSSAAPSSPTVITTTQVRDQGTTIQRIKEKRVFQN